MKAGKYRFRRTDNDEIVEVDFSTAINMDAAGFIDYEYSPGKTVPARRIREEARVESNTRMPVSAKIVSDALGFGQHQLAEYEEHRVRNGFTDVEFVRDPQVPEFFQVKVGSQAEFNRYVKSRGMIDRNSRNGGAQPLSRDALELAKRKVVEKYGPGKFHKKSDSRSQTELTRNQKHV